MTANPVANSAGIAESSEEEKIAAKALKLEREKKELLASLASGDFKTTKTKVAAVLNLYPHTRNSDVALALKYWEDFQPDVFNAGGIQPKDLFKLERLHYIVRARAKIQNEYGLFLADDKIKRHRRHREEEMRDAVLEDSVPRRMVHIYADETGKTQDYVIVAAVWVLNGRAVFDITRAILSWQEKSSWAKREVHFAKFGKGDLDSLSAYLDVVQANRQYISFKLIAVERAGMKRSIEEVVQKLHEHLLLRGLEHEVSNARVDLPREIEVTLDQEQSLDKFTLADMKQRIADEYTKRHEGRVVLTSISTVSSRHSPLVQLADVVAGAVNRRLNPQNERGYKDEMADMVIDRLGLSLQDGPVTDLDATAMFLV